ncbi:MAG TPA: transposase [Acidobacteriaceae bacterium]|jgi:hypothetical protein
MRRHHLECRQVSLYRSLSDNDLAVSSIAALSEAEDRTLAHVLGVSSVGKRELESPLAGKSTLNRLELCEGKKRYHKINHSSAAIDRLLVDLYRESQAAPPEEIVLDLDTTDIPLHRHQPGRFFHGYNDGYCYLPLYSFAGEQLLCARLRPSHQDSVSGAIDEVSRMVGCFWPQATKGHDCGPSLPHF